MGDAFQARATHASHRACILGLGLSVGIAIALAGCHPDPAPEHETARVDTPANTASENVVTAPEDTRPAVVFFADVPTSQWLSIIHDSETGCEYISRYSWGNGSSSSITPRLNAQGKPKCGLAQEKAR